MNVWSFGFSILEDSPKRRCIRHQLQPAPVLARMNIPAHHPTQSYARPTAATRQIRHRGTTHIKQRTSRLSTDFQLPANPHTQFRKIGKMAPIPIALCGKHPDMAQDFITRMLPEYEVVHVCHSAPVAISELRALLRNERTEPSSGLGSNCKSLGPIKVPKAIFIGGGFAPSEVDDMKG